MIFMSVEKYKKDGEEEDDFFKLMEEGKSTDSSNPKPKEKIIEKEKEKEKDKPESKPLTTTTTPASSPLSSTKEIKPLLKFLIDPENPNKVYIGRKKSVQKQYGNTGLALIGRVAEDQEKDKEVYLDGLNPHVVFLDGARGTGKSYLLGVIAEELARNNHYIGQIVIDPVGVFWSMKYENKEAKEIKILEEWGQKPEGIKNLKVFVPEGVADKVSKDTYDDTFSMYSSLLTPEDWCITFGIERFSPSGLLLEKTIEFVKKGYTAGTGKEGDDFRKIKPKGNQFTLDNIIDCLSTNTEFTSQKKGYKPDSIRALVSRFDAAKSWGIFSDHGTTLSKLSRENQLTILDTSFLDENITALVIGILARRILSARKVAAREDASKKIENKEGTNADELLETEIPPTWLYIDEAHTLIPSGNTLTPATAGIIEYVKQGRRPGCSLVFATQQPSAINTKVLSQVDILISNKLVFNDDISAIQKRMPAIIPDQYKDPNFIKTIPFATALVGDRSEETSRAFIMRAAPRKSQHEGRDAETVRDVKKLNNSQVLIIATTMIYKKLEKSRELKVSFAKDILEVVNIKYRSNIGFDEVLEKLFEKKVILKKEILYLDIVEPGITELKETLKQLEPIDKEESFEDIENELVTEKTNLISKVKIHQTLPLRIKKERIEEIARSSTKKSFIIFSPKEYIKNIVLKYRTIYKFNFNVFNPEGDFKRASCYMDSVTGEFIHFLGDKFRESRGFNLVNHLDEIDLDILFISKGSQTTESIARELDLELSLVKNRIETLKKSNLLSVTETSKKEFYKTSSKFDVPFNVFHKLMTSVSDLALRKLEIEFIENIVYSPKLVEENLKKLFGEIEFISLDEVYWPIWHITLVSKDGREERTILIDGVLGQDI